MEVYMVDKDKGAFWLAMLRDGFLCFLFVTLSSGIYYTLMYDLPKIFTPIWWKESFPAMAISGLVTAFIIPNLRKPEASNAMGLMGGLIVSAVFMSKHFGSSADFEFSKVPERLWKTFITVIIQSCAVGYYAAGLFNGIICSLLIIGISMGSWWLWHEILKLAA